MRRLTLIAVCVVIAGVDAATAVPAPGPLGPEGVPIPKAPVLAAPPPG